MTLCHIATGHLYLWLRNYFVCKNNNRFRGVPAYDIVVVPLIALFA